MAVMVSIAVLLEVFATLAMVVVVEDCDAAASPVARPYKLLT